MTRPHAPANGGLDKAGLRAYVVAALWIAPATRGVGRLEAARYNIQPSRMPHAQSDHPAANGADSDAPINRAFWALTLGSIGVVYGDIGTSPLYALRIAVEAATGEGRVTESAVLGVLSLIFWSLIVVVTLKYVLVLLRADNNGEGGTLALTALAFRALGKRTPFVIALGIVGASMFYGSTLITPALSVLSAVEGLHVATAAFGPYVLPLTVVVLIALFAVQSRGTARVATFFAPIMIIWFIVIAVAGAVEIVANPAILAALNPVHGLSFLASNGMIGLVTLAAVFLAVTGSEALYNDLGHFGRKPIQTAWLFLVLPALLLNYFGQGALVLAEPRTLENPFYLLFPDWALYPMVALATAATAIASQAVITGAYSITRQAMQLGFLPRMEVRHTSESLAGQIYMPRVNWLLLTGTLLLVFMFRSSSELAAAYVLAVATTEWTAGVLGFIAHLEAMALAALGRGGADDPADLRRHGVRACEHARNPRRRVDARTDRRGTCSDHVHMAARHAVARAEDAARRGAVPAADRESRGEAAASRAGDRRVPNERSGFRADGAPAQS